MVTILIRLIMKEILTINWCFILGRSTIIFKPKILVVIINKKETSIHSHIYLHIQHINAHRREKKRERERQT